MPDDFAMGHSDFSPPPTAGRGPAPLEDPVVSSGRREALWTLSLWLAAAIYSVTYCIWFGYQRSVDSLTFVLWFPDWVFWGIVVPWLVCAAISIAFALRMAEDEPLASAADLPSEDAPPDEPHGASVPGGRP